MMHTFLRSAVLLALAACVPLGLADPLSDARSRETPLHFGLYVTPDPEQNPIDPPERFTGYHAGLDFEIKEGEEDSEIPVYAICAGEITYASFAEGYGGLVVERCTIGEEDFTVLYGHLQVTHLPEVKSTVEAGQQIGILAPARSTDSDGNRKHLHLGIHRGETIDFRGYVQSEEELSEFIDPAQALNL